MNKTIPFLAAVMLLAACADTGNRKISIILDSDANNELDDQHAIAYMLFNRNETYDVCGITTNATRNGGDAMEQAKEADRVVRLAGGYGKDVPVIAGATGNFEQISQNIGQEDFDGAEAVNFIICAAKRFSPENRLTLVPVGKLTNIALAVMKDTSISRNIRVLWLGSNYPGSGEYNLENDIPALNYLMDVPDLDFAIVTVHPNDGTFGTSQVSMRRWEINDYIAGKGPLTEPVEGRSGGRTFTCFGDYSQDLFEQCSNGINYERALFDMAAVAVSAHPEWAMSKTIPAPVMIDGMFVERPENPHTITIYYNFNRHAIINSLIETMNRVTAD